MATVVSFHAHPDDEAISTGGTLAKASAEGHRVVLVVATRGELGQMPPGLLAPDESVAERRTAETLAAAEILGIHRVEFLDYLDSGMDGEPSNEDPRSFWRADVDDAAARLAAILDEERADVLTTYDEQGGYGHPDHIQVHRVGMAAAASARTARVLAATMNRDHFKRLVIAAREQAMDIPDLPEPSDFDGFGMGDDEITTAVDVTAYMETKRAAMAAHASQIAETSFFLSLPEPAYSLTWGTEWFVRNDAPAGTLETSVFEAAVV